MFKTLPNNAFTSSSEQEKLSRMILKISPHIVSPGKGPSSSNYDLLFLCPQG